MRRPLHAHAGIFGGRACVLVGSVLYLPCAPLTGYLDTTSRFAPADRRQGHVHVRPALRQHAQRPDGRLDPAGMWCWWCGAVGERRRGVFYVQNRFNTLASPFRPGAIYPAKILLAFVVVWLGQPYTHSHHMLIYCSGSVSAAPGFGGVRVPGVDDASGRVFDDIISRR